MAKKDPDLYYCLAFSRYEREHGFNYQRGGRQAKEKVLDAASDKAEEYIKSKFRKDSKSEGPEKAQELSVVNSLHTAEQTKLLKQQQEQLKKQEERAQREDLWQEFQKQLFLAEKGVSSAQFKLGTFYRDGTGIDKDQQEALTWFERAAVQGNADAVTYLTSYYTNKADFATSEWLVAAAEKGNPAAMYLLGSCYDEGIGVKKSLDEAFRWYESAASKNYPAALIALGVHYFAGNGVGADESQAIRFWSKLPPTTDGLGPMQMRLVACAFLADKIVPRDTDAAVRWMNLAAERGDPLAQCHIGNWKRQGTLMAASEAEAYKILRALWPSSDSEVSAFLDGNQIPDWIESFEEKNALALAKKLDGELKFAEAFPLFVLASENGNAEALYQVGLYYSLKRVPCAHSDSLALTHYQKAAGLGFDLAEVQIGLLYKDGLGGVQKNSSLAIKHLRNAAAKGNAAAVESLGACYFEIGDRFFEEKNYREALRWYRLAAKENCAQANHALGHMHEHGIGVVRNLSKAMNLYAAAAKKGHKTSAERIYRQCRLGIISTPLCWNSGKDPPPPFYFCCFVECCGMQPLSPLIQPYWRNSFAYVPAKKHGNGTIAAHWVPKPFNPPITRSKMADCWLAAGFMCCNCFACCVPATAILLGCGDCLFCAGSFTFRGCCCCEWPVEFSPTEATFPPDFEPASSSISR